MTDTTYTSRLLGSAWPGHFNKPIAEAMYENIKKVGLPQWSEDDQTLAKASADGAEGAGPRPGHASFRSCGRRAIETPAAAARKARASGPTGGGSDDIGDISWNVPTVTLRYPSNIPGGPGHNWANAISMATPIAHKGVIAGAKVQAMTMLDILLHPELVEKAWDYFNNVQTKEVKYKSFLRPDDKPAIWLNTKDHGEVPAADEEALLRSVEVRHLSGAARHQVSDGEVSGRCPSGGEKNHAARKAQDMLD